MKILNTNNLFYKIFSVVLAVLLWLYVSHQENPLTEQVFTVPLEIRDLAPNLVIDDQTSFVKVRIQGQREDLNNISARDIYAFLEMDGTDVGMHLMEVNVSVPGKARLVSVIPSSLNVKVEVVAHSQVPVVVSFADDTPAKGYMALQPVLNPTQVLISGPEDKLDEINEVIVEVNLNEATGNYHQKLPVKVANNDGDVMPEWLTVDPREVDVLIPVIQQLPSKMLPVNVPLTGNPAPGYKVERVVIEPEVLSVYGKFAKLELIDSLTSAPVSIEKASQDVTRKVDVNLPEGLTMVDDRSVTVVVRIGKLEQKSFTGITIVPRNIPEELNAELELTSTDVVLEGLASLIENLEASQITAYVDLENLTPGEHQAQVKVDLPENITLVSTDPNEIRVNLQ